MSSDENSPVSREGGTEEEAPELESSPPEDTFRILLATDNHLGYKEKDGEQYQDSFDTFEEILGMAEGLRADFLLLGGDLFHENRPSLRTMHKCTELLRQYALNNKPVEFQLLSDQTENFSHSATFPLVNYEDPNLNVGLPIFSIHGNHDDPLGPGGVCALDLFHASGLVNLFGKVSSVERIKLTPILLRKGTTRLALYGLGACRDERLHRLLIGGQVEFLRPVQDTDATDWFYILVLHQNRSRHGATNYIPESLLPDFLNLVIWGHEHECRIKPEWIASRGFYVSQPGSSVATSLSQGESGPKAVGLIEVHGTQFRLSSTSLRTVRPFIMEDLVLEVEADFEPTHRDMAKKVEALCTDKVDQMIEEAKAKLTGHPKQPVIPLIRVRVDYSGGYESFSAQRFGQKFVGRVANPKDLLIFHRRREKEPGRPGRNGIAGEQQGTIVGTPGLGGSLSAERVEVMVRQFFETAGEDLQLRLLVERVVGAGITAFVDKDVKEAISMSVQHQVTQARQHLAREQPDEEDVLAEVAHYRDVLSTSLDNGDQSQLDFSLMSTVSSTATASDVSASRGGRGGRGGRGKAAGAANKQGTLEASFSRGGGARNKSSSRASTVNRFNSDESSQDLDVKVKMEEDEDFVSLIESDDSADGSVSRGSVVSSRGAGGKGRGRGSTRGGRGAGGSGKTATNKGAARGGGTAAGKKRSAAILDSDESSQEGVVSFSFKKKKRV